MAEAWAMARAPATAKVDAARNVSVGGVLARVLPHMPWRAVLACGIH
jgi:hypothetical protein